jgi:Mrp family chromosome partitioning ATPase
MDRAAESPLPLTFRALGETPALHSDPQVRLWLDSLEQVDKLREPFGAIGAGDPIYIALTARVNELGRSIRDAAKLKQSELRARIAPLQPPPPPPPVVVTPIDTVPILAARAVAQTEYQRASRELAGMREENASIDRSLAYARELANLGAPPLAMLAAALVIAIAIGFSVAFAAELRHPRLAHTREAEVVAGTRVLAVIRPTEIVERGRRQSDVDAPPLIDIVSESYRTLYLHLAAIDANIPMVTVTGDIVPIVATVASNLAAVAAYEARSTLLVDVDAAANGVAAVLRIPPEPGLAGLLFERADWPRAVVSTTIGRDRPLDVLPAGHGRLNQASAHVIDRVRKDFTRMERRYDFIVVAAPTSYVQLPTHTVIPAPDVVLCVRIGDTRLSDLRAAVKSFHGIGRRVHGLVLWDDEIPRMTHHV